VLRVCPISLSQSVVGRWVRKVVSQLFVSSILLRRLVYLRFFVI